MKIRIAKYRSNLYFNHRCKENKVLPFSLRFKPPIRSKKGYKDSQANEREYFLNILGENDYPKRFLNDCLRSPVCRNQNNSEGDTSVKQIRKLMLYILYHAVTARKSIWVSLNASLVHG
jgi:hypothetical protein